jgi:hypothetical protein
MSPNGPHGAQAPHMILVQRRQCQPHGATCHLFLGNLRVVAKSIDNDVGYWVAHNELVVHAVLDYVVAAAVLEGLEFDSNLAISSQEINH